MNILARVFLYSLAMTLYHRFGLISHLKGR
jgi:hypothetical protein